MLPLPPAPTAPLPSPLLTPHALRRKEIDFVGANIGMAIIADFMLTWLPAPTLSYA